MPQMNSKLLKVSLNATLSMAKVSILSKDLREQFSLKQNPSMLPNRAP